MNKSHRAYQEEQQHVEDTIREMKEIMTELDHDISERSHKIGRSLQFKDQVSAYVHTLMRSDNANKIGEIESNLNNPYFGRVDFREDGTKQYEKLYIGRTKVARPEIASVRDILIFDWRDPIATVFYECQDGRATYEVDGKYTYTGDVRLKRQFKIEDGVIVNMADDNILSKLMERQEGAMIADPFLKERLLQGAGDRLKDIVTSIRSEQNKIIRETLHQVTIIQGVAGSGKSTIGLHRLSYLLYNEKLDAGKLVIIAPNKLFLDYISELLPEIDAQDVKQMTFHDIAEMMVQMQLMIQTDQVGHLFLENQWKDADHKKQMGDVLRLKGSLDFLDVLKAYVDKKVEKYCLKLQEIQLFNGQLVIGKEQQLEKIMEGANVPYNERIKMLSRYLHFRVQNFIDVLEAKGKRTNNKQHEQDLLRYKQEAEKFLQQQVNRLPYMDLLKGYSEIFKDKAIFKPFKDRNMDIIFVLQHSLAVIQSGKLEKEDVAPLCYLKYLLDGFGHITKFDHIVVDEAQDLNAAEFAILKLMSNNQSFTIMGDISQGIYSYRSIDSWQVLTKDVFAQAKCQYHEVNHSYRSAQEIVEFFNRVMPRGFSKAIPVYEIGCRPQVEEVYSNVDGTRRLLSSLQQFYELHCKSVGIITKREAESRELHEALQQYEAMPVHLITSETVSYEGGISIVPVSLAKGLEFDAVILWNASDREFTADPLEAKLLYVALSRAMYYLHIFYQGKLTPLLNT